MKNYSTGQTLAEAMRRRARWLGQSNRSNSSMESGWGDRTSVIAALYEMADVVDSWNGEYLSKEDSEEEWMKRRYGSSYRDPEGKPLTMQERRAIVGNTDPETPTDLR